MFYCRFWYSYQMNCLVLVPWASRLLFLTFYLAQTFKMLTKKYALHYCRAFVEVRSGGTIGAYAITWTQLIAIDGIPFAKKHIFAYQWTVALNITLHKSAKKPRFHLCTQKPCLAVKKWNRSFLLKEIFFVNTLYQFSEKSTPYFCWRQLCRKMGIKCHIFVHNSLQ